MLVAVLLSGCGASLGNSPTGLGNSQASKVSTAELTGNDEINGSPAEKPAARRQAGKAAREFLSKNEPDARGYVVGPADVLQITVFKVPDLTKTVMVSSDGTINLPLVGEQVAAGLSTQQIERKLTRLYGAKYLQNPQIGVLVREANSQRVTVEGAVKKPGVYPLRASTTLIQMIATAQGLDEDAESTIIVFRQTDGKRKAAKFDLDAIREGRAKDPTLRAGDVIIADKSASKSAFKSVLKALPLVGVFAGLI